MCIRDRHRTDSVDVDIAIFTNLTHDHLDYHGTMENYFEAKKRLFDQLKPDGTAITNKDDPHGMAIVADCPARVVTYGVLEKMCIRDRLYPVPASRPCGWIETEQSG